MRNLESRIWVTADLNLTELASVPERPAGDGRPLERRLASYSLQIQSSWRGRCLSCYQQERICALTWRLEQNSTLLWSSKGPFRHLHAGSNSSSLQRGHTHSTFMSTAVAGSAADAATATLCPHSCKGAAQGCCPSHPLGYAPLWLWCQAGGELSTSVAHGLQGQG